MGLATLHCAGSTHLRYMYMYVSSLKPQSSALNLLTPLLFTFKLASKSEEASALREMVEKLQEERVSAASEAESAKRRAGEMERSFDLVETEKLGLERSVMFLLSDKIPHT